jgi:hypothetical protein
MRSTYFRANLRRQHSHDFRIDSFDAPPMMDASTEKEMPRIQSWAVITPCSAIDDALLPGVAYCCWLDRKKSRFG